MIDDKKKQLNVGNTKIKTKAAFESLSEKTAGAHLSKVALHKLTVPELIDKWNQLEGNYLLLKWKLAMHISEKFKSKIEYGRFLQELKNKNPDHALCTINQSTFYRYARAFKFCEKFEINNPLEFGISPSAIYILSEKENECVIDKSFIEQIKNKKLPVSDIKRLIYQTNSITGEVILEPIQSTKRNVIDLSVKNGRCLDSQTNNTPAISNSYEEEELNYQPNQLAEQLGVQQNKCIEKLGDSAMVQEVLKLINSFKITFELKFNILMEVIGKVEQSRTGDPVNVDMKFFEDDANLVSIITLKS